MTLSSPALQVEWMRIRSPQENEQVSVSGGEQLNHLGRIQAAPHCHLIRFPILKRQVSLCFDCYAEVHLNVTQPRGWKRVTLESQIELSDAFTKQFKTLK